MTISLQAQRFAYIDIDQAAGKLRVTQRLPEGAAVQLVPKGQQGDAEQRISRLTGPAMRQAQRIINVDGLVTADGKRHPAFGIMNAAQTTQRLCAAELGLTPVSRSRPAVRSEENDDDNPFGI